MLATSADEVPTADGWAFEVKWDGVRGQLLVTPEQALHAFTRRGREVTAYLPELRPLAEMLGPGTRIDGELVVQRSDGSADFQAVMGRITRRASASPVVFVAFDVLAADAESTMGLPYWQRRERLARWPRTANGWYAPEYQVGHGPELFIEVCRRGLEGIVAKRLNSVYRPSARSPDWRKVLNPEHGAYQRVQRSVRRSR